jgi:hypothetical protein
VIRDEFETPPVWSCLVALHQLLDLRPGVLICKDCGSEFADPATC